MGQQNRTQPAIMWTDHSGHCRIRMGRQQMDLTQWVDSMYDHWHALKWLREHQRDDDIRLPQA